MILTLTANPSLDRTIELGSLWHMAPFSVP